MWSSSSSSTSCSPSGVDGKKMGTGWFNTHLLPVFGNLIDQYIFGGVCTKTGIFFFEQQV